MSLHRITPVITDMPDTGENRRVHLKMEAWQPSASFKIRGIGRLCQTAREQGARRLVASSGGNAGYAVAYAARCLGMPATVWVPTTTPASMRGLIASQGAEVLVRGSVWDETDSIAREAARADDVAYVSPFDHPEIWRGHATIVEELTVQIPKPEALVLAVGGGGLLSGILEGLERAGWADVRVVCVETEGAASFHAAWEAGRPVTLDGITSIATSLGAKSVCPQALQRARRYGRLHTITVSDRTAVRACLRFADRHRTLVEPACGAALAAVYEDSGLLAGASSIALIVCGGAGVDLDRLETWKRDLGIK